MKTQNASQLMEYQSRINTVIDYIEGNLEKQFTLDDLAKRACFSKYHFHRIFNAIVNETLFEFIQRLRVEKAANMLSTNQSNPITQIALECGFSSSAAFSRSFRERFEMTATQWRKSNNSVYSRYQNNNTQNNSVQSSRNHENPVKLNGLKCEVKILQMEVRTFAYIRYIGPYEGDSALFQRLYTRLYKWAYPRDLISDETNHIVVYHDSIDITDVNKLRVSASIEVPNTTEVSGDVGTMRLKKGKYASIRFKLGEADYYDAWNKVYSHWLPSSGFQPDDGPCYESFPFLKSEAKSHGKMTVDLCIPVKPL